MNLKTLAVICATMAIVLGTLAEIVCLFSPLIALPFMMMSFNCLLTCALVLVIDYWPDIERWFNNLP